MCKGGDVFSLAVLIDRGLDLFFSSSLFFFSFLFIQFSLFPPYSLRFHLFFTAYFRTSLFGGVRFFAFFEPLPSSPLRYSSRICAYDAFFRFAGALVSSTPGDGRDFTGADDISGPPEGRRRYLAFLLMSSLFPQALFRFGMGGEIPGASKEQDQGPRREHGQAGQGFPAQFLFEDDCREKYRDEYTQLVDGQHDACLPVLEGTVIA